MHELSVCQALVGQLETLAREQQASRVVNVLVGIGPLSGVEPELLRHAFPLAAAGTAAQDAGLIIEDRPVRVHCLQCGEDSDASVNRLLCGHCGDWRTELLSGDELMLVQVEFMRERAYV
jgi:hydrogenase nickel incorporation protein HypA/HybF